MSSIASVSSASPVFTSNSRLHNHRKTTLSAAEMEPSVWTAPKPDSTTQGLFSNLLHSLEKVKGLPGIAAAAAVAGAAAVTGTAAAGAAVAAEASAATATSVGVNVNANA